MANLNLQDSTNIKVVQSGTDISLDFATGSQVDTNTTNIGDLTNLNTPDDDSLVDAINSSLPISLYDNSNGSTGNITLSDDASNYQYLEIFFFVDTTNAVNSVKIYSPDSSSFSLFSSYDNGTYMYQWTEIASISTTTITRGTASRWRFAASGTPTRTTGSGVSVYIYKVIGYK